MAYGDLKVRNLIWNTGSGDNTVILADIPPKNNPTFTGVVTVPTAPASDVSTKAASTAFVDAYYATKAAPAFTGSATGVNLTLSGNLVVNGTTTTINTQTLDVEDKNISLGKVSNPSDTTADGGGITLLGSSNKTFNWVNATDAWTSSEHIHLGDNKKLLLGVGAGGVQDLQIYSDGTEGILLIPDTGNLKIKQGSSTLATFSGSSNQIEFYEDVLFDGQTAGRDIIFDRSENYLKFADQAKAVFGTNSLTTLFHNGTDLYIQNGSGDIRFEVNSGAPGLWMHRDGSIELYDGNASGLPQKKFNTTANGADITGGLNINHGSAQTPVPLIIDGSGAGGTKIELKGSAEPRITYYENTTLKAYLIWQQTNGEFFIQNTEHSNILSVGATPRWSSNNGTSFSEMLHQGNVGSGGALASSNVYVNQIHGDGSNLSNLPASGGAIDVVASGNVTANTAVMIKSDGTCEAVSTVAESNGNGSQHNTYANGATRASYSPDLGKVIVVWTGDGISNWKGYYRIGNISGTTISWGSADYFDSGGECRDVDVAWHPGTNRAFVTYRAYYASGQPGYARLSSVCAANSTSINWGSAVQYKNDACQEQHIWYDPLATDYLHVCFRSQSGGRYASFYGFGTGNLACVTGTNNATQFTSDTARLPRVCRYDGGVYFCWRAQNNSNVTYGRGAIWNANNSDYDFASAQSIAGAQVSMEIAYSDKDNRFVAAYVNGGTGDTVGARIGTLSGTGSSLSVSWGSELATGSTMLSQSAGYVSLRYDTGSDKFFVVGVGSNTVRHRTFSLASNNASFVYDTEVTAFTGYGSSPSVHYCTISNTPSNNTTNDSSTNGKYFTPFVWFSGSSTVYKQPMYFIKQMAGTTWDANKFLGIAKAGYSNGQTASIGIIGGTLTSSSLTPNTKYYVQNDGTIGTTETATKVGKSYTSTKILLDPTLV